MRHFASALAAVLALVAPPALAQNLVTNAGFDTNVDFWTPYFSGGTLVWSPLDWAGNPSSGSGFETNAQAAAAAATHRASTCMIVPTTGVYEVGGHIRIPGGQASTGRASVDLIAWEGPGCQGVASLVTLAGGSVTTATTDVWVPILVQGLSLTQGMAFQVALTVAKDQAGGTLAAHFDFARFGPQGTTPVELLEFVVE